MIMNLKINHLSFGYLKRPLSVVDFSCELKSGETLALLGGEGAGKTSLLRVISGLEKQYAGTMFFDGRNAEMVSLEERCFSYLPSEPVVFENKTIAQNFQFLFGTINRPYNEELCLKCLRKFGIEKQLNLKMKKLTSAEKKVFSVVRCFIKNPKLILLDDLFQNENKENCLLIKNAILTLFNEKSAKTSLIYVENPENQLKIANHYVYLSYGKNTKLESFASLKANPVDLFSCDFFENFKKDYSLMFDGNNYYLLKQEFVYEKKKLKQVNTLGQIKIDDSFNEKLEKQKLSANEQMQVSMVSYENIEEFSDAKLNTLLKNGQIFMFDKNTFTKVL